MKPKGIKQTKKAHTNRFTYSLNVKTKVRPSITPANI